MGRAWSPESSWRRTGWHWIPKATSMSAKSASPIGRRVFRTRRCRKRCVARAACRNWRKFPNRTPGALLRLDVRCLHDRPPALGLRLLKHAERFRRLLIDRGDLNAQFGEALLDLGIGQNLTYGGVELGDDVL